MEQQKNGVVELWWTEELSWEATERLKGLEQSYYCKIGKRIRIKWKDPGHMVEDRYVQAGEILYWKGWGGRTEGDRGTFSLYCPSATSTCAWRRWSMLRISAMLPPLSFSTWCQDNGSCEPWAVDVFAVLVWQTEHKTQSGSRQPPEAETLMGGVCGKTI